MVATAHLLLYSSPLAPNLRRISATPPPKTTISFPSTTQNPPHYHFLPKSDIADKLQSGFSGGGSGNGGGFVNPWSSGGRDGEDDGEEKAFFEVFGYLGRVLSGWVFRWIVTGDSQFPFMLLIKELVGGVAFGLLEKPWNAFGAQLQSVTEAVLGNFIGILLFPFVIVLMEFFALYSACATGVVCLFYSAMAVSLLATSACALYFVIHRMRGNC